MVIDELEDIKYQNTCADMGIEVPGPVVDLILSWIDDYKEHLFNKVYIGDITESLSVWLNNSTEEEEETPQLTIWCPFETNQSNYYKILTEQGHKVITGDDKDINFFINTPEKYDLIVSAPDPVMFINHNKECMNRLIELNTPYAMLLPLELILNSYFFKYFKSKKNSMQLIIPNKQLICYGFKVIPISDFSYYQTNGLVYICNNFIKNSEEIFYKEVF